MKSGLFRAALEAAPNAIVIADVNGTITFANTEAEHMFGYAPQELHGRPLEVLVPDQIREQHQAYRTQYSNQPTSRRMGIGRELHGRRKDGTKFPVEIGLKPGSTDEGSFIIAAVVDITARRRLERRFELAVNAAPTAMVMVDSKGHIVLVNAETERLFGYQREELHGQLVEKLLPERFGQRHPAHRRSFFETPRPRTMGVGRQLFGVRKDGREFPVEVGLNPVATDEGLFVMSAIVDLTERIRLEDGLRRSNDALEKSNLELQHFAYVASHDLQTPLRAIASYADLLREDNKDVLSAKGDMYLQRIVGGCLRMKDLINDLLAVSRVDSQAQSFEPTNLEEVYESCVGVIRQALGDQAGTITRSPLPTVNGDASQLSQLFHNLLGNAVKYRAEDRPPVVRVTAEADDKLWSITVEDNGIGIDPRHHEKIFEMFRRLHTHDKYPGTGIGLAVCRRIVTRHGGTLWVESALQEGSKFRFTLPRMAQSE